MSKRPRKPAGDPPDEPEERPDRPALDPDVFAPVNDAGAPYFTTYADEARRLAARGAGEADLALHFKVSVWTIKLWRVTHPEFASAIAVGREVATDRVEAALYERAIGYSAETTRHVVVNGSIQLVRYLEHVPPDVGAARFWLVNNRPEVYRERVEVATTGGAEALTDEELARIVAEEASPAANAARRGGNGTRH